MAKFDAVDAAFEGFRITREQPQAVLVWSVISLILSVLATTVLITMAGEAFGDIMDASRSGPADPEETLANMGRILPAYGLLLPLALVFYAVLYSAIYRSILRPGEGGPGFVRFGGDELRVGAAMIAYWVVVVLSFVLAIMLASFIAGLLSELGGGGLGALVGVLLGVAVFCGFIWVGVRLSLCLPMTFAEKRIRIFESWRLTQGVFWPLFGANVLALVLSLVIGLLALMIYFAIAALLGGGVAAAASVFQPAFDSLGDWFTPVRIFYTAVAAVVAAVTSAVINGVSAAAYRDLSGRAPEPVAA